MKRDKPVPTILSLFLLLQIGWVSSDRSDVIKRMQLAATVMHEIMAAPDKAIPEDILSSARCVAVAPSMIKGGFIVGENYGKRALQARSSEKRTSQEPACN